jgi:hypothetical protein
LIPADENLIPDNCNKKMYFALLLSFCILSKLSDAAPVKFMSFNIDCRFCDLKHENGDSWDERVANELDTMARHNPDIMGIQEPIFAKDVEQLLPAGYTALYNQDVNWLPWGVYPDAVIFYRTDRFIPKDFQYFWLGPHPNIPAGFDRFALPRLAVYALFQDKLDGTEFYFGSTHFDHGDDFDGKNVDCVESAKELLNFTAPIAAKYPFIWVGDFNSQTANNNAYSILTNQTAEVHLDDSYYASVDHTIVSNVSPLPDYDYNHSIDHIFVSNNYQIASYKASEWTVDMYKYGSKQQYASDHWAIFCTIDIKQL